MLRLFKGRVWKFKVHGKAVLGGKAALVSIPKPSVAFRLLVLPAADPPAPDALCSRVLISRYLPVRVPKQAAPCCGEPLKHWPLWNTTSLGQQCPLEE